MIQRIQSLFLLGVVILAVALFFVPVSEKTVTETTTGEISHYVLSITNVSMAKGGELPQIISVNYPVLIVNLLILILAATTLFLFKNRPLQIRLSMLGSLVSTILLILIFYYSENMGDVQLKPHYQAGVYLIAVQVFLFMAARRSIRKDEMLVRAADRIR
jgi:hypothetical protein